MDNFNFFNKYTNTLSNILPKISLKKDILEYGALAILGSAGLY